MIEMMKKHTDVGGKGVRTSKMPLTAVVLAMAILLMTVGDVASAQTAPVEFARGGAAPRSQQAITIPSRPDLRSPIPASGGGAGVGSVGGRRMEVGCRKAMGPQQTGGDHAVQVQDFAAQVAEEVVSASGRQVTCRR